MHYLIDGYNLLFRIKEKKGTLEKGRQELIQALNEQAAALKLHLTLVFDAGRVPPAESSRGHIDALEIVYTAEKQSADEYILLAVEHARYPDRITVVTSDRELATRSKMLGANAKMISEFINWLIGKVQKKRKPTFPSQKAFQDTPNNIERLIAIFEKRLLENEDEVL